MPKVPWCLNSWKSRLITKTSLNLKPRNPSLSHNKTKVNLQPDSNPQKTPLPRVLNLIFPPTRTSNSHATVMPSLLKCAMSPKLMLSNSTIKMEAAMLLKPILIPSWVGAVGKFKAKLGLPSLPLKLVSQLSTMGITSRILRKTSIACSSRCSPKRWGDSDPTSEVRIGRRHARSRKQYRSSLKISSHSISSIIWMGLS